MVWFWNQQGSVLWPKLLRSDAVAPMLEYVLLVIALALATTIIYLRQRYRMLLAQAEARFRGMVADEARRLFDEWRAQELQRVEEQYLAQLRAFEERARAQLEEARRAAQEQAFREAELELARWQSEKERDIREDAIRRSMSSILGRIGEELAPLIMASELGADPRDFRHVGTPVDYVVFKGLSRGNVEEVIFLEVKTGRTSALSEREKAVRRAVEGGRVRWMTYNLRELAVQAANSAENAIRGAIEEQTYFQYEQY